MTKTALITGASGGIGYEFAQELAANGYNLVLVARSAAKLKEIQTNLTQKYAITVKVLAKDLSRPESAPAIFNQLESEKIVVDVLINNAGFGNFGEFTESEWQKEADMLQVNIFALTHLTKLFVKGMVERRQGKILNVASTAAFMPGPLMAVYYATKSYVLSFSEAIANELQGTGVSVTVLCPGPTESGFQAAAAMEGSKILIDKKLPTSAEVAKYGYQAMQERKVVAIHGWNNWLLTIFVKFLPRKKLADIVRQAQAKAH
jgi:uncharacterized protein